MSGPFQPSLCCECIKGRSGEILTILFSLERSAGSEAVDEKRRGPLLGWANWESGIFKVPEVTLWESYLKLKQSVSLTAGTKGISPSGLCPSATPF